MTVDLLRLTSADLEVTIDPGGGGDVLSLVERTTGVDVLFRSPWRERADAVRDGGPAAFADPVAGWLERYRGGWQTLCPGAGQPRRVHGAPVGFHGELASLAWEVDHVAPREARLHVELFAVPVRVDRVVELSAGTVRVHDRLTNLSDVSLELDYSQHPALGGVFLDGACEIRTGAARFVADPDEPSAMEPGSSHAWPDASDAAGNAVDLARLPGPDRRRALFGWLEGFTSGWASVSNPDLGLTVRLEWDADRLPYAWFWQELNASEGFPWYRRARVMAIEPASTQTSGPSRRSVLRLAPRASTQLSISVAVQKGGA